MQLSYEASKILVLQNKNRCVQNCNAMQISMEGILLCIDRCEQDASNKTSYYLGLIAEQNFIMTTNKNLLLACGFYSSEITYLYQTCTY